MIKEPITTLVKIAELYLSIETLDESEASVSGDHTDVVVKLDNGQKYIASFFTCKSIEQLKLDHQKTGEYLSGKYFRVENMVLVEDCARENIRDIVQDLIDEGDFYQVFKKI